MNPEEIKFWAEVEKLIVTPNSVNIEYRLFYNEQGEIIQCTMIADNELHECPYLVVTKEEYDRYFQYRVVNGNLKKIDNDAGYRVKLERSNIGYQVVKNQAGLLLEPNETYTTTEYYAHRNN